MTVKTLWSKDTLVEKCKGKHIAGLSGLKKPQLWEAYIAHCTLAELNQLCQEFHWTGHSHFNKAQLIDFVRGNIKSVEDKKGKQDDGSSGEKHTAAPKKHTPRKPKIHDEDEDYDDDEDFIDDGAENKHKAPKKHAPHKPAVHKVIVVDDDVTSGIAKVHVATKHTKAKIPDDVRRSCFKIVFGDKLQGKCPVCKFAMIAMDKGQFQAAHIKAEAKGGATVAENLVPSCGCNQIMGTTNLFDYMGSKIELRSNLWELACAYWVACTPRATMEKELKKLGRKFVLVEFLKIRYQPVDIEKYKDWLEIPESWSA